MQAFSEFMDKSDSFWAFVKFTSERLGYTKRGAKIVKSYTVDDICNLCNEYNISLDMEIINSTALYSEKRATLLNGFVKDSLMDATCARDEFCKLQLLHTSNNLKCILPLNKQSGPKGQIAFFTAIINILTELTIRDITGDDRQKGFDDDPHKLVYILNADRDLIGVSSRRFDGAFPGTSSPSIVWEIKEYYYTTTFGSRIADGVYETLLDGFEFKSIYERTGKKVFHILFIDAYSTWWDKGKSYLCRIIDALNSGLVDEVIVGREVLTRWPELLRTLIKSN